MSLDLLDRIRLEFSGTHRRHKTGPASPGEDPSIQAVPGELKLKVDVFMCSVFYRRAFAIVARKRVSSLARLFLPGSESVAPRCARAFRGTSLGMGSIPIGIPPLLVNPLMAAVDFMSVI